MADGAIMTAVIADVERVKRTAQRIRRLILLALRRQPWINTRAQTPRLLLLSMLPPCDRCLGARLLPQVLAHMRSLGDVALVTGWRYGFAGQLEPMGTPTILVLRPPRTRIIINQPPMHARHATVGAPS